MPDFILFDQYPQTLLFDGFPPLFYVRCWIRNYERLNPINQHKSGPHIIGLANGWIACISPVGWVKVHQLATCNQRVFGAARGNATAFPAHSKCASLSMYPFIYQYIRLSPSVIIYHHLSQSIFIYNHPTIYLCIIIHHWLCIYLHVCWSIYLSISCPPWQNSSIGGFHCAGSPSAWRATTWKPVALPGVQAPIFGG